MPRSARTPPVRCASPPLLRRDGHAADLGASSRRGVVTHRLVARHGRPARVERRGVRAAAGDDGGRPLGGRDVGNDLRVGVLTSLFETRRAGRGGGVRARARRAAGSKGAGRASAPRGAVDDHAADHAPGGHERPPPWLRTRLADYGADVRARLLAGLLLRRPPTSRACVRVAGPARSTSARSADTTCSWHRPCRSQRPGWTPSPRTTACCSCPTTRRPPCSGCRRSAFPAASSTAYRSGSSLIGRPGEDGTPLAAAKAFQQATDWHEQRPERRCRWHVVAG